MAVWLKLDTRLGFVKVPLEGLSDVYDLCSTACKELLLGISGDCLEVTLVAPPGPRPTPDALAAAFSTMAPLFIETSLSDSNVVAGSWLVARITNGEGALAAANASATQERMARLDTEELLAQALEDLKAVQTQALEDLKAVQTQAKLRDEEYNKQSFLAWMLSISSSASGDTASHADEKRRGGPSPTISPLASVLAGPPELASSSPQLGRENFCAAYHWAPP